MLFWYHKKNTHAIIFFFLIKIRILIESKHNLQSNEHEQKKKRQHTSTPKQRQSNKPQTDSIPLTPIGVHTSLQNIALKPFPCKF